MANHIIIKFITVKNKVTKQFCQATNPRQRVNLHQKFKTIQKPNSHTESSKQRKLLQNVF